jgi:hypothetical protein
MEEALYQESFFQKMSTSQFTSYIWCFTIIILFTLLFKYIISKGKNFLDFRNKLKEMQENYERKRNCRNDLLVINN